MSRTLLDERLVAFLQNLNTAVAQGKLQWERTAESRQFRILLPTHIVRIGTAEGDQFYFLEVTNEDGYAVLGTDGAVTRDDIPLLAQVYDQAAAFTTERGAAKALEELEAIVFDDSDPGRVPRARSGSVSGRMNLSRSTTLSGPLEGRVRRTGPPRPTEPAPGAGPGQG